jgi:hypothetical protein
MLILSSEAGRLVRRQCKRHSGLHGAAWDGSEGHVITYFGLGCPAPLYERNKHTSTRSR